MIVLNTYQPMSSNHAWLSSHCVKAQRKFQISYRLKWLWNFQMTILMYNDKNISIVAIYINLTEKKQAGFRKYRVIQRGSPFRDYQPYMHNNLDFVECDCFESKRRNTRRRKNNIVIRILNTPVSAKMAQGLRKGLAVIIFLLMLGRSSRYLIS